MGPPPTSPPYVTNRIEATSQVAWVSCAPYPAPATPLPFGCLSQLVRTAVYLSRYVRNSFFIFLCLYCGASLWLTRLGIFSTGISLVRSLHGPSEHMPGVIGHNTFTSEMGEMARGQRDVAGAFPSASLWPSWPGYAWDGLPLLEAIEFFTPPPP